MLRQLSAVVACLTFGPTLAAAQPAQPPSPPYETLFYSHDGLRLESYFFKPDGAGPFPLIVYNHGSAPAGEEPREWPVQYIARIFVPAGYALLVPERRGYGKSEGLPFSKDIGTDRGARFVHRHEQEAGDINAAVDYLLTLPAATAIDRTRVVIMGWSFGGIVTTLAASRDSRYAAVILQAPGALNWDRSEDMRKALLAAASKIRVPTWCGAAENDATTENAKQLCAAVSRSGAKTVLKIYPPFISPSGAGNAPGHAVFAPAGVDVWKQDVLTFVGGLR